MKKLIFIFLFFFLSITIYASDFDVEEATEECNQYVTQQHPENKNFNIENDLFSLNQWERETFIYCMISQELYSNSTRIKNKNDLFSYRSRTNEAYYSISEATKLFSIYERDILEAKRELLSGEKLRLSSRERKRLREVRAGLTCGGQLNDGGADEIIACMSDSLKYEDYLEYTESGLMKGMSIKLGMMKIGILNWIFSLLSEFLNSASFGYSSFDKLPELKYESKDMFNTNSIYGVINSFALAILGFLILFYFLKKGTSRDEDDFKTFFIKLIFIFIITLGFPVIYTSLQSLISIYEDSLINSLQFITNLEPSKNAIQMNLFHNQGLNSFTALTIVFFLINIVLLFIISFIIYIRDTFIIILSIIFFLTSIGMMVGMIRKDNIFETGGIVSKGSKFLVNGLFWSLGVFISVVISIFIFKFITVILSTFPSIESPNIYMVEAFSRLSIDAFVYLLLFIINLIVWYKYLLPATFSIVSEFIIKFLFPTQNGVGNLGDFTSRVSSGYEEIKIQREKLNQKYHIDDKVNKGKDLLSYKIDTLKQKNEHFAKVSEFTGDTAKGLRKGFDTVSKPAKRLIDTSITLSTGINTGIEFDNYTQQANNLKKLDNELKILEEKKLKINPEEDWAKTQSIEKMINKVEKNRKNVVNELYNEDYKENRTLLGKTVLSTEKQYLKNTTGDIERVKKLDNLIIKSGERRNNLLLSDDIDNVSKEEKNINDLSIRRKELLSNLSLKDNDIKNEKVSRVFDSLNSISYPTQKNRENNIELDINNNANNSIDIQRQKQEEKNIFDNDKNLFNQTNEIFQDKKEVIPKENTDDFNIHSIKIGKKEDKNKILSNGNQKDLDNVNTNDIQELRGKVLNNKKEYNLKLDDFPKEDIDDFISRYEREYKEKQEEDNIEVFGDNKLVEAILKYKLFNDGDTNGIGQLLDKYYIRMKN